MTAALPAARPVPAVGTADERADELALLREQVDALDVALIGLLAERARLSRRAQAVRQVSGASRVDLPRERRIRETYRSAFGVDGPHLADAILLMCRGER